MSERRVCRLCLWRRRDDDEAQTSTHLVNLIADGNDLLHKISTCLPLKVSKEDDLPKYICNMCSNKLEGYYQFRSKAIDSENRLLIWLKMEKEDHSSQWPDLDGIGIDQTIKSEVASVGSSRTTDADEFKFEIKLESTEGYPNDPPFPPLQLFCDDPIKQEQSYIDPNSNDFSEAYKVNKRDTPKKRNTAAAESKINGISKTSHSWNCCICSSNYSERRQLLQHYRVHCITVTSQDKNNEKVEQLYRCSLCEKTFKSPESILKHGREFHSSSSSANSHPTEGKADMGNQAKRFTCDICDEKFLYMRYLLLHRNAEHPETRNQEYIIRCDYCQQEFTHINSLRRHLQSHMGKREFLCNTCGKVLSSQEHLKCHMRIHTGHKPNVCRICGKGFVKKCNLILHERVHSGERPHVCSFCGKAFSQRSTLVIHERYHSGARPYVCQICNKGFVAQGLLSVHLKTVCGKSPT